MIPTLNWRGVFRPMFAGAGACFRSTAWASPSSSLQPIRSINRRQKSWRKPHRTACCGISRPPSIWCRTCGRPFDKPMPPVKSFGERIADVLVEDGLLTPNQVAELLEQQKKGGMRLLKLILEKAYVSDQDMAVCMGRVLNT